MDGQEFVNVLQTGSKCQKNAPAGAMKVSLVRLTYSTCLYVVSTYSKYDLILIKARINGCVRGNVPLGIC